VVEEFENKQNKKGKPSMKNLTPIVSDADSLIKKQRSALITQQLVGRLQEEAVIYQGQFEMGMRPRSGPYTIDDRCFIVPNGKEIVEYSIVSWSMFGGHTSICRKDMLSVETLAAINAKLKKGKVSFCTVYDAFVLWDQFRKKPIKEYCWIGTDFVKTSKFDNGIFMLENNDKGTTCLLLGEMYEAVTFSSRCRIFLRYESK
jgi:hypothetical protein